MQQRSRHLGPVTDLLEISAFTLESVSSVCPPSRFRRGHDTTAGAAAEL